MNPKMQEARTHLTQELEKRELTRGMQVRVHGDHLIMGRTEDIRGVEQPFNCVRLTRMTSRSYGLSVKRHTGRWERTPFAGSMTEMVDVMCTFMQHLIADH